MAKDGRRISRVVHRLVAEAFIPNPDNKPQVNHIDGDKTKSFRAGEWRFYPRRTAGGMQWAFANAAQAEEFMKKLLNPQK